jgi:putative transposase
MRGGESDFPIDSNNHYEQVLKSWICQLENGVCPSCQSINGRDENAAKNIYVVGASTAKLGDVRQAMPAIAV